MLLVLAFFAFPMSLHKKATTSYYEITIKKFLERLRLLGWLWAYRTNLILNACQDGTLAMSVTFTPRKGNIEKIEKSANHLLISVFNIS